MRLLTLSTAMGLFIPCVSIYIFICICKYNYQYKIIDTLGGRSYSGAMIICTLKEVLRRKGWSVYRLQKESAITYPTLLALVHGKTQRYSGDVLNRLCYALHCRPADLLKWVPDRFSRVKRRS